MKLMKIAAAASLLINASMVNALGADGAECYSLPHGKDGQGSYNTMYLPHQITSGPWTSFIYVTNAGYETVNVKLNFTRYNGTDYKPYDVSYGGAFNNNNSPLKVVEGSAMLRPKHSALITIREDEYFAPLAGYIRWQADSCIDKSLVVSVRSHYDDNLRSNSSLFFLNGGNPF